MTVTTSDHVRIDPAILYLGTPVVLVSTLNPDGTANLAPFSSAFWLGHRAALGIAPSSRTHANLARTHELVIAMPSVAEAAAVDRIARTSGRDDLPPHKRDRGYVHVADKFAAAGLTPVGSDLVAPPRPAETPIAMECAVRRMPALDSELPIVEVEVLRTHAHPSVLVEGRPNRIDPDRWRPLIMSFQQFYGLGERVRASRLADIDEELYRV